LPERGGHGECFAFRGRGTDPGLLVPAEEEQPVVLHRTAEGPACLVAFQQVGLVREVALRIQAGVPDKPETVSMELVGAALGDHIHRARGALADLRARIAGLHRELGHRVGKRERHVDVLQIIFVVAAVQRKLQRILARAVYRKRDGFGRIFRIARRGAGGDHAGGQARQRRHVPPVERKLQDALAVHHRFQCGIGSLHGGRRSRYFDLGGNIAHLQHDVDFAIVVDFEHDPGLLEGAESGILHAQPVRSDRDERERKLTGVIGQRDAVLRAGDVGESHARTGHDRALCIEHGAIDTGGGKLLCLCLDGHRSGNGENRNDRLHRVYLPAFPTAVTASPAAPWIS
jgi:hypothetical protein